MIYWFTGQPGSGKTTLARAWANELGCKVVDGDQLRILFPGKGYDRESRLANVATAQIIARWEGACCVALIAPYRDQRDQFKARNHVVEVYLTGNPGGRREYWVKEYEPPLEPDMEIDTGASTVEECLNALRIVRRQMAAVP